MFTVKKTYVQTAGKPAGRLNPGLAQHAAAFTEGRWMCSACGMTFQKKGSSGVATPGNGSKACTGRCNTKEAVHLSHCIHTAKTANGIPITFCTACGHVACKNQC